MLVWTIYAFGIFQGLSCNPPPSSTPRGSFGTIDILLVQENTNIPKKSFYYKMIDKSWMVAGAPCWIDQSSNNSFNDQCFFQGEIKTLQKDGCEIFNFESQQNEMVKFAMIHQRETNF